MKRSFIAVVCSVAVLMAACSSDESDADATIPTISLPDTTASTAEVFDEVDGVETSESVADGVQSTTPTMTIDGTEPEPPTTPPPAPTTTPPPEPPTTTPASSGPPATPAPPETTTPPAPTSPSTSEGPFDLRNDGLGSAAFGAEPEGVISFVSSFLGAPSNDTGWTDPFTFGACGGEQIRQVSWGVLTLEFGDVSNVASDRLHFYAYFYGVDDPTPASPIGLRTPEGITIGSTVAELIAAYPDASLRSADEFISPNFFVNDNLRGLLTGLTDTDSVTAITGGLPCEG